MTISQGKPSSNWMY